MYGSHANDWDFKPQHPWSCLCEDELLLNHSLRFTIAWPVLGAIMVPRESFRRKKWLESPKRAMLLIKISIWNVGNNKKKGQLRTGHCRPNALPHSGTTIIFFYCWPYWIIKNWTNLENFWTLWGCRLPMFSFIFSYYFVPILGQWRPSAAIFLNIPAILWLIVFLLFKIDETELNWDKVWFSLKKWKKTSILNLLLFIYRFCG